MTISSVFAADEVKTVNIGDTEVFYEYRPTETDVATLTLIAQVSETNDSLRGLKNTDRRRLRKLGQLIYQCKLMLYKSGKSDLTADGKAPVLISKNYSLFTGVKTWETLGEDSALNLKQFNVNVLQETDLIETSESVDIIARFPVFQVEKPVSQWIYNFNLKDFKQAIHHIDENCTPVKFRAMIEQKT
jgi:hypothetical protein